MDELLIFLVLRRMHGKYSATLAESKRLNGSGLLQKANSMNITADKILYEHAIQSVSISDNLLLTIS